MKATTSSPGRLLGGLALALAGGVLAFTVSATLAGYGRGVSIPWAAVGILLGAGGTALAVRWAAGPGTHVLLPALLALAGAVAWMGRPFAEMALDPATGLEGPGVVAATLAVLLLLLVVAYLTRGLLGRTRPRG